MSKFKIEFTLKQHTPIIHFQSEQIGATLRATELKPKLDRFLIEHIFQNDVSQYKKYLIDKDKEALNYKVKILSNNVKKQEFEKYPPLYFARDHKQKMLDGTFIITFIAFKAELLEILKKNFEAFLVNTNFGTRQSKGYGGYYIKDKKFDPLLVIKERTKVYWFDTNIQNWEKDIKLFYGFLRAGINEVDFNTKKSKFYAKSLMFLYAKNQGITWDKKAIKEHFINHSKPENCNLMKDLLGLSTNESWKYKDNQAHLGLIVKKSSTKINRYKSPITFKPIQEQDGSKMRIYFYADQINANFLDQSFEIQGKGVPLSIKTPQKFDIDKFFVDSFNVDLLSHIESKYISSPSYKKLDDIFKTLKGQI
jgi:CRISPR/Cas system CMR-associated protein Cmr1 (group 7 of RAMP superfamily)